MDDLLNPHFMGKFTAFAHENKGGGTIEEERNEFFEVVDFVPRTGMVEIGFDGVKGAREYVKLPLPLLVGIAAAFGRPTDDE
jgi:hypothetical protein